MKPLELLILTRAVENLCVAARTAPKEKGIVPQHMPENTNRTTQVDWGCVSGVLSPTSGRIFMPNIARDCDFAQKAGNNTERCIIYVQLAGCCFTKFLFYYLKQTYQFSLKSDGYTLFVSVLDLGKLFADVYWQLGSKLIYW